MSSIGCPSCHNLNWVTRAIGASIAHCVGIENTSQIVQLARELGEKMRQFDVFNVCRPGASPAEPKAPMSVRFSYVNSVFEKVRRKNHEETTKCKWNLEQWLDYVLQFFFPTSLCGVLVFGCALPPASSSRLPHLPTT